MHVTERSGNAFADLGLPNAEQELTKVRLTLDRPYDHGFNLVATRIDEITDLDYCFYVRTQSISGEFMENHDQEPIEPNESDTNQLQSSDRRGFLGGFGALGLAAISGIFDVKPLNAQESKLASSAAQKLASIGKVNVLRDENSIYQEGMNTSSSTS